MDWRAVIPNILEDSRLKRELQGNVLLSVDWGMKGAKPSIMSLYSSTRVERPNRVEAQRFLFNRHIFAAAATCTAGIGREGRRAHGLWQQGAPQQPHCFQGASSSLLCVREIDFQSSLFLSFFLVFLVRSICLSLSASFFLLVYFWSAHRLYLQKFLACTSVFFSLVPLL